MLSTNFAQKCGILSPLIALIFIFAALASAPWFSWEKNCLSDLGGVEGEGVNWWARGTPSLLFNFGVALSGVLACAFAFWLRKSGLAEGKLWEAGTILFLAGALALVGIGVFPEPFGVLHSVASILFFVLVPVSMLLMGAALARGKERRRKEGIFALALGLLASSPWIMITGGLGGAGLRGSALPLGLAFGCAQLEGAAIIPMLIFCAVFSFLNAS
ncbi:MAG: DUF998 domain-containing protein [Candidatus Micrarchaeota archaeon]